MPLGKIRTALRAGGRQRNLDARAREIAEGLRVDALQASDAVVSAFAATTRSQVAIIAEINAQIGVLETELVDHLNSTRTPTSTSPSQESVSSSAPGRSASSGTTRTVMSTPSLARTTPARHPSPARPGPATSRSPRFVRNRRLPPPPLPTTNTPPGPTDPRTVSTKKSKVLLDSYGSWGV